jgi:hypothetical protein
MRFSTKKGRPIKNKNEIDLGTKELRLKKSSCFSDGFLIFLKQQKAISETEYEMALWFRYLYNVKFGNPNIISAYNPTKTRGFNLFKINQDLQIKLEELYNKISCELQNQNLKNMMIDLCVFEDLTKLLRLRDEKFLEKLKKGLGIIKKIKLSL